MARKRYLTLSLIFLFLSISSKSQGLLHSGGSNSGNSSSQVISIPVTSGLIGDYQLSGLAGGTTSVQNSIYGQFSSALAVNGTPTFNTTGTAFNGSTDYLLGKIPTLTTWTVLAIVKPAVVTGTGYAVSSNFWALGRGVNLWTYLQNGFGSKNFAQATNGGATAGLYEIIGAENAGSSAVTVWAPSPTSPVKATATINVIANKNNIVIGAEGNGNPVSVTAFWNGEVRRVLLYNRALSDAEYASVYAALLQDLETNIYASTIFDDFQRADTVAPTMGTSRSGWPWITQAAVGSGGYISNNLYVADANSAEYIKARINHTITRYGLQFHWAAAGGASASGWCASLMDSTFFDNMYHICGTRAGVTVDMWQNSGTVKNLLTQSYPSSQLTDGTSYRADMSISGSTLTVDCGTGGVYIMTDPLISTLDSKFTFFEHTVAVSNSDSVLIESVWVQ